VKGGVLCSGSIVYDTVVRPVADSGWGTTSFVETIEYHVGGNGANTSLTLATIGMPSFDGIQEWMRAARVR